MMMSDNKFSFDYVPTKHEFYELVAARKDLELDENYEEAVSTLDEHAQEAIQLIFFPDVKQPNSTLLKRGPVVLNGNKEQELFLFTSGFVLANVHFDAVVDNYVNSFAENSNSKFTKADLRKRFDALDLDGSGYIDLVEIYDVFNDIGIPVSKETFSKVVATFDEDSDGKITFDEFLSAFKRHDRRSSWINDNNDKQEGKRFWWMIESLAEEVKKSAQTDSTPERKNGEIFNRVDCAYCLVDVDSVEGIDTLSLERRNKLSYSGLNPDHCFAIAIKGNKDPLVVECIDSLQCDEWKRQFKHCFANTKRGKRRTDTNGWKKECSLDWGESFDDSLQNLCI